MGHQFAQLVFTPTVRKLQESFGSRTSYARLDEGEDHNQFLGENEMSFLKERDSLYMASVSETGWPYLQHRGGPTGFVKVIDEQTLGFADYSGNRQYVSTGNFRNERRIALFFMDYPNRRRLKLLGSTQVIDRGHAKFPEELVDFEYPARVERAILVNVRAFDWNCPAHITPRFSAAEWSNIQSGKDITAAFTGPVQSTEPENEPERPLGNGPLDIVVSGVRQLTPGIRAFELRAGDGRLLPEVEAGAHLILPVRLPGGQRSERRYSIASDPARRDAWEIAVRRDDTGKGGSTSIHADWKIGTRLLADHPANHFAPGTDSRRVVLLAGGIGITPIKSMAHVLARSDTDFTVHYAGRCRKQMAYVSELELLLGPRLNLYSTTSDQRLDVAVVLASQTADTIFFVCGPQRLLQAVRTTADQLGIEDERVRFEMFQ